ncbi:MAG: GrpB family protein, partial [Oscillospiraceae bacterium]|nr:GrpB family protein [Oscillospiraceae bacterium]
MSIGLRRGTVLLRPHSTEWETDAQNTIKLLKNILKDEIVDAQHIGSTSIKTICAKPIIDIAVGVRNFDNIDGYNELLKENGFIYRREDHSNQRLYICGDFENNIHTHYIHMVIWGGEAWNNYINMRDYLNTHPGKADEYARLKQSLADKYAQDRVAYTEAK